MSIFGLLFGPKLLLPNDRTFFTRVANWLPKFDGFLFFSLGVNKIKFIVY